VKAPTPPPLPVLLPLEKGLGVLAFEPDPSIERPGQSLSRSFRGAAFSVLLWPVKTGALGWSIAISIYHPAYPCEGSNHTFSRDGRSFTRRHDQTIRNSSLKIFIVTAPHPSPPESRARQHSNS